MTRMSDNVLGYLGSNPFREAQARTFGDDKIILEFFPTSIFLSLFNEQHEILLGTRGSGKTALLRMLSYSRLRRIENHRVREQSNEREYIGFYVPLHLEFMAALPGKKLPAEQRMEYFQFAFNCSAIDALLAEMPALIEDCLPDTRARIVAESTIVEALVEMWFPEKLPTIGSVAELRRQINLLYHHQPFWPDGTRDVMPILATAILMPVLSVLPIISQSLGLDTENTHWVACIDEAEWLEAPFIRCINTFLRSEKRPLVVKMATLPFKHVTRETVLDGLFIEPDGNDFNYRVVDMDWNSDDFLGFTDHISNVRLSKSGVQVKTLAEFLGREGKDQGLDYFRLELEDEASDEGILHKMLPLLSKQRQERYDRIKGDTERVKNEYILKFSPVYYVRRMRELNSKAARKVGWFAGAKVFRQVADGNPRRFIQLMNDVFEIAREQKLTPKHQHQAVAEFCNRANQASEGLPEYGSFVKHLIDKVGELLQVRVHGLPMVDGGCGFMLSGDLIERKEIVKSLELALDYSHIIADDRTERTVTKSSIFRLAFVHAVHFWLPLRKSTPVTVQSKQSKQLRLSDQELVLEAAITQKRSQDMISQLQLELFSNDNSTI